MTCTEATPDCNKGINTTAIEAVQGNPTQHTKATTTEPAMTHHTDHTADHPQTPTHQVCALRTAVDHIHVQPTDH